jgi:hypothetical protein
MYCRQKRLRLEAQQRRIQVSEAAASLLDNDRQGPLSSVFRVQGLAEEHHMIENCESVFTLDVRDVSVTGNRGYSFRGIALNGTRTLGRLGGNVDNSCRSLVSVAKDAHVPLLIN